MDGGVLAGRFLERIRLRLKRLGLFPEEKRLRIETSAVDVLGQHYGRLGEQSFRRSEWDLVKNVVTCREKVLIQLESLILAQSERWRQA